MGRKLALLLATATGAIALASCGDALKIGPGGVVAIVVAPDSVALAVGSSIELDAVPIDSTGAFLQGFLVTWTSSAPGVASVDEIGTVTGLASGSAVITATVEGFDGNANVSVDLAPSISLSIDTVAFSAVAGGADPPSDSVTVANGGGFTLDGISVSAITYADSINGWLAATLDSTTAPATLVLSAISTGITVAATYTASVEILAATASAPDTVAVALALAADVPDTVSISAGDNQVGVAGGAVTTLPSVRLIDQFDNPVPGITVTFSVTGGGGSITGSVQVTDAQGTATVGSWTLGSGLGAHTLQALVTGLPPITFTATANPAPASVIAVIAGDGQSTVAGTSVPTSPQVQVTDAFSNPVAGIAVTFAVTAGGGSTVGPSQTTDANGLATVGTWTLGTVVGTNTLDVTATGVAGTATFTATGIAGAAAQIASSDGDAQTDTVAATLATAPAVLVTDLNGNPVAGVQVTYAVATGGGSISAGVQTTDAAGTATLGSWTLGAVAGAQSLTATAAGVGITGNPVTISATATAGAAFALTVGAGDNQSATAGTAVGIPPEAVATDQFGNPIAGVAVTFAVTSGGGSITGPAQTTDVTGMARVTSWTLGAGVGSNTLQATSTLGLTGEPVVFTATGISGTATTMALVSGNAQTDTIGAPLPTPYTVRITDTNGNGVPGVPVAWNVTGGGGSIPATATTDAAGLAVATHTLGDVLGPQTVDAAVGGLTGSPVMLSSTATVGNPATMSMIPGGNNQTAVVNTAVALAPEVLVVDRVGNTISGVSVTFSPTAGGGNAVGGAATTGVNGQAAVTSWTLGTSAGASNNTLQALVAGSGITNNPLSFLASATPGAVDLAVSTISGGSSTITANDNASSTSAVTITITDQFGNPLVGETVTFSASGTSNFFSPNTSGTTAANGQIIRGFYSTQAVGKTISASVTGKGALPSTAAVTVNPAAASLSASSMDATEPITASAGTVLSTVSITVLDAFLNPRAGDAVTISVTGSGNSLNQPGSTNASGQTTASWSSTVAQTKTVSAIITGVGTIQQTDLVLVDNGPAASIVLSTGSGQTAVVGNAVITDPRVLVRDAFNNPVDGVSITFTVASGGGSATGTSKTTSTSGLASVTSWTLGASTGMSSTGTFSNSLQATAPSNVLSGEPVSFSASAIYSYATHVQPIWTSNCNGCHNWTRATTLGVNASCDSPNNNIWDYVATGGGTTAETRSVIMHRMDGNTSGIPGCNSVMPPSGSISGTFLTRLRAWIRNGAPNN